MTLGSMQVPSIRGSHRRSGGRHCRNVNNEHEMATQLVMTMVTVQRYIRCHVHPVSLMMCKSKAEIEIFPVATPTIPKI
jgi:hypothetical protein